MPLGVDKLLAIASRELWATQEEFRRVASRLDAAATRRRVAAVKDDHPAPGAWSTRRRSRSRSS